MRPRFEQYRPNRSRSRVAFVLHLRGEKTSSNFFMSVRSGSTPVNIVTRTIWVQFPAGVRPTLEHNLSRLQWIPAALSPELKRVGREADHAPPSSAEVKTTWSYTTIPPHIFMALCLVKRRIHLHVKGKGKVVPVLN
jgi:hypothetical protein